MLVTTAAIALAVGVVVGWALSASRAARANAERDLACTERERAEVAVEQARRRADEAQQARAAAEARATQLEKGRAEINNLFVNEAQRAFKSVSESLVQMSKQQIDGSLDTKKAEIDSLLKPVRDMLDTYRNEVVRSEKARNESYGGLQEQIKGLLTVQEAAHREASRLANVLKSPTSSGSWGEISLRRTVELAGMSEYCDFVVQESIEGEDGRRLRPDMMVRLPNNRVIAVDSKVPIAMEGDGDEEQRKALIRRHIDSLSRKEYQNALGDSLDFMVMFVPGEQFLIRDNELFEYAAQRKIFVASPAILIPLLRAVNAGWKAEKTEENAKRMHDAGVELFNRFVNVMDKIAAIGRALESTVGKYNEAIRSIDSRLWPKGEEMQRMAGSGKELASLGQIEAVPLQSSKLRLTMQSEEDAPVVPIDGKDALSG